MISASQLEFLKIGLNYLFGRSEVFKTISEAQSFAVFQIFLLTGLFTLSIAFLSILVKREVFFSSMFAVAFILALLQVRFSEILAVPASILSGMGLHYILQRADIIKTQKDSEERRPKKKKNHEKEARSVNISEIALLGVLLVIILAPSAVYSIYPPTVSEDWYEALIWISANTPQTSYYTNPENKPEYSILSWWDYGNWIIFIAKRPVVANNFQIGVEDAAMFFTSADENEAIKILEKRGVKYVITSDRECIFPGKSTIFFAIAYNAGYKDYTVKEVTNLYKKSMLYKLHIENAKNLNHFRLVKDFGTVKIFEFIP